MTQRLPVTANTPRFRLARILSEPTGSGSSCQIKVWPVEFVDAEYPQSTGIRTLTARTRRPETVYAAAAAAENFDRTEIVVVGEYQGRWWIQSNQGMRCSSPCPSASGAFGDPDRVYTAGCSGTGIAKQLTLTLITGPSTTCNEVDGMEVTLEYSETGSEGAGWYASEDMEIPCGCFATTFRWFYDGELTLTDISGNFSGITGVFFSRGHVATDCDPFAALFQETGPSGCCCFGEPPFFNTILYFYITE